MTSPKTCAGLENKNSLILSKAKSQLHKERKNKRTHLAKVFAEV